MEVNSLIIFTKASQMLAEADTIQKAKELKNLALTAADWAKRKGMGEEAIQYARSYALEAERKMGEMLLETERGQGKRTDLVTLRNQVDKPTLSDLGITKRESSEAQMLAGIPRKEFEEVKSGKRKKSDVKREIRKTEREAKRDIAIKEGKKIKEENVFCSAIENITLPPNSVDVIITDPPYDDQHIQHYSIVAKLGESCLKPGRFFCCYAGKLRLPEVINAISPYLEYIWTISAFHPFSKEKHLGPPYNFAENWRPVLIWKKSGKATVCNFQQDVVRAERDKEFHDWQQDLKTPLQLIEAYTDPREMVLDPFCGGGTTLVAAKQLGRNWLGFDVSEESVALSKRRLYGDH
jgi:DNA modification methylase